MAVALVQQAQGTTTSTTSVAATFGASPTQNNLMVGVVGSNDGSFTNPTGWTTSLENLNTTEDDVLRVIHKVAGAGESTTVTCTAFVGNTKHLNIFEFSGTDASSPLDVTALQTRSAAATSVSSGTTATTAQADEVAVAGCCVRADVTGESANNSFTLASALGNGTFSSIAAYKILAATGTQTTTFSWTTSGVCWGIICTFKGASGGVTGTLNSTLAAVTLSGAGTVQITGSLNATLGAVTLSGAATIPHTADLNATLGTLTLSAAGTIPINAALAATLGAVTLSATGGGAVAGTLSSTLGAVTLSGAGTVAIAGSLASTLGAVTLAAAGTIPINGSLSATLGALTLSGTGGAPTTTGDLSATLGSVTLTGAGAVAIAGALSQTLGALTLSGAATIPITGSLTQTLGALLLTGLGGVDVRGALSATLGDITLSGTGTVSTSGLTLTPDDLLAIADAVWSHATAGLLLKIERNKVITDPATGVMTVYDDDGTTILLQGNLFEDAAGVQPYRGRGAERRERLT